MWYFESRDDEARTALADLLADRLAEAKGEVVRAEDEVAELRGQREVGRAAGAGGRRGAAADDGE